jgi:hypothetical protein
MAASKLLTKSFFIAMFLLLFINFGVGYYVGKNENKGNIIDTVTTVKIEQKYDSTPVFVDRPIVILRVDSYPIPNKPVTIDSLSIVNRWLTGYVYRDSLRTKDLFLMVTDTIEQNRVKHRQFVYKILRADSFIKEVKTIKEPIGNAFFVGAGLGVNRFSPGIIYNIKNTYQIGVSSNLIGEKPSFEASFFYRIK